MLDGLSVDGLARYRRKRVKNQPRDNLTLTLPEEDVENRLTTVYRLAFRASSEELFRPANVSNKKKKLSENPSKENSNLRPFKQFLKLLNIFLFGTTFFLF